MAFLYKVFIRKNTPELRDKLEELGYHICVCCKFKDNIWLNNYINDELNRYEIHGLGEYSTENSQEESLNIYLSENSKLKIPAIDCGENEELFLALAALRNDNDYMQWFVSQAEKDSPKVFIKSATSSCTQSFAYTHRWDWRCSKATVEELIEYFNGKRFKNNRESL